MYYTGICSWCLKLESDPQNQWRGYWRVYSMDGVRILDLESGNLYSHPSSAPYPSMCLKKFPPSLDFSFLIYETWKMNMWISEVASQVPWIHWKEKLCLGWPDTIWAPHVGHRIIWGLAACMAAPEQGAAHSPWFFLQGLRNLKPYSYWVKAEEDRATILSNTQYPTGMLKQKRACAGNLVHQCLCRGVTSCENPFPQNVDYDPGASMVMRFL